MSFPPGFSTRRDFSSIVLAQAVQNHIVIMQDSFEVVFRVIDDDIGPEALHQIQIAVLVVVATVAPRCFASWIANVPTPPEPAWMRTFCPFFRSRSFDQDLPGSQADQRDGSRFFHRQVLWLDRHIVLIHRNEFRERADPVFIRPRIDLVAGLEPPHTRSDLDHDPSRFISENERQAIRQNEFELPSLILESSGFTPAAWTWTNTSSSRSSGSGMSPSRTLSFFP